MDIFNKKEHTKQLEYLEEERKKLWKRITDLETKNKNLEKEIQKKALDSEKEAAQSSRKASEYRNKIEDKLTEANSLVSSIKNLVAAAEASKLTIEEKSTEIETIVKRSDEREGEFIASAEKLEERIQKFDTFLVKYPDLEPSLVDVDANITKIAENLSKSTVTVNTLNKRKVEIDTFYREVFGYTDFDEDTGTETKIEGSKDDLEKVYDQLVEQGDAIKEGLEEIDSNYKNKFSNFEKEHKDKYTAITSEIASLLPNALTAGLSAAFSKKKEDEEQAAVVLQKRFTQGIYSLIGVSLIPFILSAIYIYQGVELQEAVRRLPRLVLAIIPLYVPILWFTYSANKKLNLSKRLIEEYAHKEVLSKTYEGLSKQITGIENNEQSSELKFRLLSNFLQVTSENPGKLISNYEASDHPIMEALEQSYKFQIAIDKLEGIPGMGRVAAILESKAKRKLDTKKQTIEKALDTGAQENQDEIDA